MSKIRELETDDIAILVASSDDADVVSISTVDGAASLTVWVDGEQWGPKHEAFTDDFGG